MVDFEQYLDTAELERKTNPVEIFDDLNKETGKEELWSDQKSILSEWYSSHQEKKDLIIKLPTGRGKTLVGLLVLQSLLNNEKGPALYLCPNKYLVNQTIQLAESFGIKTTKFSDSPGSPIPSEFVNLDAILVTTCQRLFNGKSKFGIRGVSRDSQHVGAIVVDDAHKCQEIIREAFSIIVDSNSDLYKELLALFSESLQRQERGTFNDIIRKRDEALLAVPYWSWIDNEKYVIEILSKNHEKSLRKVEQDQNDKKIIFTWDLIKNHIQNSDCYFSGRKMEIVPRLLPLDLIPSFSGADNRFYLSATLADDVFLVKNFNLNPDVVTAPLTCREKKYSGERLIIIPTLIDNQLDRNFIIEWLTRYIQSKGDFGVFALVNSSYRAHDWKGSEIMTVSKLEPKIQLLISQIEKNVAKSVFVLINGYDGVDLPDRTCRILCLDSLPSYTSLSERFIEKNLPRTRIFRKLMSQRIEQGIGRSIRGSNDWSAVLIIGNDLTSFISDKSKRVDLSDEVQKQISIGELLIPQLKSDDSSIKAIEKLLNQFLARDDGWKRFYKKYMVDIKQKSVDKDDLTRFVLEREAELLFQSKQYQEATDKIQQIIDNYVTDDQELGWYLQFKALYFYPYNKTRSIDCQKKAHQSNNNTFCHSDGISYSKLLIKDFNRESAILDIIKNLDNYNTALVEVDSILDKISFNVGHDIFEEGIQQIGTFLGFGSQRPEKDSKREGAPDNLWQINSNDFWIIECKNEVIADRGVSRDEIGQIMNSIGWFEENYPTSNSLPIIIHPSDYLEPEAHPIERVKVFTPEKIENFKRNVKTFFISLTEFPISGLTSKIISDKLISNNLALHQLEREYLISLKRK